ncbi:hypothetical protein MNV49_006911 [Pseudohyphozyma bogoriensis]|nr:hypothetical protein MNV49_006911 [Pseudohyphozyma bogoriensis]
MPAGYLWVLSEPGTTATVEEFQDWYDNEHVPLRMNHISEFVTGARYQAADSLLPGWSAAYDIQDTSLFTDPKYTVLRANRSPREGALVVRLETLDRRTCETIDATSAPPKAEETAPFVATVAGDVEPKGDGKELAGVKGWIRSHRHKIYDSLNTGAGRAPQQNIAPKFVTVHEFSSEDYVDSKEYKDATEGASEVRRWKLYRAWPNTTTA